MTAPYREESLTRSAGAEIELLTHENEMLRALLDRGPILREAGTASCFAIAGLALLTYAPWPAAIAGGVAWVAFVLGVWGLMKGMD